MAMQIQPGERWKPARATWVAATAILAQFWWVAGATRAADPQADSLERQVKAAFLYNFAKFVDWPGADAASSILFCVIGDEPFFGALERSLGGKKINGHALFARQVATPLDAQGCQLLYAGGVEKKRAVQIIAGLANANVLTVGDVDQFAELGGMIQLIRDANRIRFAVNVDAVNRTGLRISSKLLQLSEVVRESGAARKQP